VERYEVRCATEVLHVLENEELLVELGVGEGKGWGLRGPGWDV
jgi:hypothetical protein